MGVLQWCTSCTRTVTAERTDLGTICCTRCGKVLEDDNFTTEATFVKDQSGRSQRSGNIVNTIERESRERTLDRAYDTIAFMADGLGVGGGDQVCLPAKRFYAMALEKNFTRGRRADQVAAACLYIACRVHDKPFLLIEFSEILGVNVYVLGAVFLQLCRLLQLAEHPIIQKPVDPSLFIRRFANGLLGEVNRDVEKTALRIIASMKRDWMQTGRKPSGICGAALYVSALSHGFKFSKADIVRTVHICEPTLMKRLIEFEETDSGCRTVEEFSNEAEEFEKRFQELERSINQRKHKNFGSDMIENGELLCEHRGSKEPHFAHGLCGPCYFEFMKISGGLDGGSEPPAFQRAEKERLAAACAADENAADPLLEPAQGESSGKTTLIQKEEKGLDGDRRDQLDTMSSIGDSVDEPGTTETEGNESETFSDIDDAEVDAYLHSEEEKHFKTIIWNDLNREYLQEQALKATLAAQRDANMAANQNCSAEELAAQELAAAASANAAKLRKARQQKRAAESKTVQTAAEATHQVLTKKRISSKVNFDKLKELLDDPEVSPKKSRTENHEEKDEPTQTMENAEAENDENESGFVDEYVNNDYGDYDDYSYYDNEEFDDGLC